MKLILVRHGETDYNKNRIRQGQLDIDLNELGIEQAESAAEKLKGMHFDFVLCSSQKRAKHTAQIILNKLGSDIVAVTSDNIREINLGNWVDRPYSETPIETLGFHEKIGETGESYHDLYSRVANSVNKILESAGSMTILVITHKGVIGAIHRMLGLTNEVHANFPNAEPIEIEINKKLELPDKLR